MKYDNLLKCRPFYFDLSDAVFTEEAHFPYLFRYREASTYMFDYVYYAYTSAKSGDKVGVCHL